MLVLARKRGQRIKIGDDIVIRVLKIDGTQVWLGIDAPGDLSIIRAELLGRSQDPRVHTRLRRRELADAEAE